MTEIRCPGCGKMVVYEGNEFRPFCSERCKLLDFGAWAEEEYTLPAEGSVPTEEELAEMEKAFKEKQEK